MFAELYLKHASEAINPERLRPAVQPEPKNSLRIRPECMHIVHSEAAVLEKTTWSNDVLFAAGR